MKHLIRRSAALLLAMALVLGLFPVLTLAAEAIEISDPSQITDLSAGYILAADITVTAPIGSATTPFTGSFDGNGHTVTVKITGTRDYTGLFAVIGEGGSVSNFKLKNSTVNSTYLYTGLIAGSNAGSISNIVAETCVVQGYRYVGGMVGSNTGSVTNCALESGTVRKNTEDSGDFGIGGIVGENAGIISACSNGASLYNTAGTSNHGYFGGIAGKNTNTVSNCYNFGTITSSTYNAYRLAGIVGQNNGVIDSCHNYGALANSGNIYGIAYSKTWGTDKGSTSNCYYLSGCGAKDSSGTVKTAEEFKTLAETLGESWADGMDGYPVLTWQTWKYEDVITPGEGTYTVEHYTENLDGAGYTLTAVTGGDTPAGQTATAEPAKLEGFTFDESNENNVTSGTVTEDGSLVLKLYYSRNSYTLSWDAGEGSIISEEGTYTAGTVKFEAPITAPTAAAEGKKFNGWSPAPETMPACDTTCTALWGAQVYTVNWNANGGTPDLVQWSGEYGSTSGANFGLTFGQYIHSAEHTDWIRTRELPTPKHDIKVFEGWYTQAEGGEKITADTLVTIPESGEFTFYAHWSDSWTVTLDPNGGKLNTKTYRVGDGLPFSSATKYMPTPLKTYYLFDGWYNGEERLTLDTIITSDVTYVAAWKPNAYTVEFYPNGGKGEMAKQSMSYDNGLPLSKNTFVYKGYAFTGWALSATATEAQYADEAVGVLLPTYNGQIFRLYAVWTECNYDLTLNVLPEEAEIKVYDMDGIRLYPTNGVYRIPSGVYSYEISCYGYETQTHSGTLTEDTVMDIRLQPLPRYTVSFAITKPEGSGEATITVTSIVGEVNANADGTYALISGEYSYTVSLPDYADRSGTFTVDGADTTVEVDFRHYPVADPAVDPTCTEAGLTEGSHCELCGKILVAQEVIDALGHVEVTDAAKEPTCEDTGLTEGSHCDRCGEILIPQEVIDALGHVEIIDAAVAPTCEETGLTEGKHCDRCGKVLTAQEVVPALGHTEIIDAAVAPTCEETGLTEGKHCDVCHKVLIAQELVPALGHKPVTDPAKEPTCEEDGCTEGSHCENCGEIYVAQETIPATGHTEVADAAKEPTCTEDGCTAGSHCDVCGKALIPQEIIPALGHKEIIDVGTPATCTESGITDGKHCEVCHEVLVAQEVIDALGHKEIIDAAVAPTCTESGLTEGKHCDRCDLVLIPQETIDALGHKEIIDAGTPATCTESGITEGKHCDVCGEVLVAQEIAPALGHSFSGWQHEKDATCTEDGILRRTCGACELQEIALIPATGHTYGSWYIAKEATGTQNGILERKCTACGSTETAIIPATGEDEPEICPSAQYSDLDVNAWYHEGVDYVLLNGLMNGMSDTEFAPEGKLTRAQLVTILYRMAGSPSVDGLNNPFTDVKSGNWYTDAVIWAAEEGVVKGTSETTFSPDVSITREQIATILFRYAAAEPVAEDHLADFSDAATISGYATEAMNWAVANGLINGMGNGTVAPGETATRAQIAVILMRFEK